MAISPGKVNLALSLDPEVKEMIKADARALHMTPASYVSMVCKLVNESTRALASEEFATNLTRAVLMMGGSK